MNKWSGVVLFSIGGVIGSLLTWGYAKKKYELIAQEEIDSVKEIFSKKQKDVQIKVEHPVINEQELDDFIERIKKENYISKEGEDLRERPYVISPDEFGMISEYDTISLTYYSNQIIVDENNVEVDDIDETIGYESLSHFGEYEDDSVFVRNDRLKCDYEILIDNHVFQREDE